MVAALGGEKLLDELGDLGTSRRAEQEVAGALDAVLASESFGIAVGDTAHEFQVQDRTAQS